MRKILFAFVIFSLLVGCAPAAVSTPTAVVGVQSVMTPAVGAVTVLAVPGKTSLSLSIAPNPKSAFLGEVKPGDTGKLLGVDASGLWLLVEIKQQTGWIPAQYLDYTIAQ